jgi:hypothetical protein
MFFLMTTQRKEPAALEVGTLPLGFESGKSSLFRLIADDFFVIKVLSLSLSGPS